MASQNEFYYKSKLVAKMEEFIGKELSDDHDLGFLSDNLAINMAEAAYLVLKQNKDVNDYMDQNSLLK